MHMSPHKRSVSEAHGYRKYAADNRSRLSHEASRPEDDDEPPAPPRHGGPLGRGQGYDSLERLSSGDRSYADPAYEQIVQSTLSPSLPPPEPVLSPPAFQHNPNDRPSTLLVQAPELRRAHSNVDAATLYQMQDAARPAEEEAEERDQLLPYQNSTATAEPYRGFTGGENGRPRDPRQRLSTIPGSPFVGNETEYFHSPQQGHMPPMEEVVDEEKGPRPQLTQLHSSHSITRKPVPSKQQPQGAAEEVDQSTSNRDQASQNAY